MTPSLYRPLREPLDIRLISLRPNIQDETICCDLVYVSLQNNPDYEALSYTWDLDPCPEDGNVKTSYSIILSGESFPVTPNLYFALKRLRNQIEARILWVHAICINQSDIVERGLQVQIMSKVYSQARVVVVWLGKEGPTTGLAFALMHEWQTLSTVSGDEAIDKSGEFWKRVAAELMSPTLAAFASLLQSRWFRRVWVIQEVVMAADVMVVCGSHSISWMTLDAFLDALNTHHFAISLASAGGTKGVNGKLIIPRIKALRKGIRSGTVYRFLDILSVTRDLQATDPRDKIYSLFSLVQGTHMPTPDYNIVTDDLFRDTNISILRDDSDLDMLAFFDYRTLDHRPNVATWMPNWISVDMKRNPLWGCEDIYAPTGDSQVQYTVSEDSMALTLRGIMYDEVDLTGYEYDDSETSAIPDPLERSVETCRQALIFLKSCESIAKGSVPSSYPGQSFEEAFSSTMVCNMTSSGQRLPPDFSRSYQAYVEVLAMFSQKQLAGNIDELLLEAFPFENATAKWVSGRVFCRTKRGYMGMIPSVSVKGDVVGAFLSGKTSFVIRPKVDGTNYYS